jgi:alkylation response protein AidB-like acyl-CoA dehydrogenase
MVFQFQLSQTHLDYQKNIKEYLESLNTQNEDDIINSAAKDGYLSLPGLKDSKANDYISLMLTIEETSKFNAKAANRMVELMFAQEVVKNCASKECRASCLNKIYTLEKKINVLFSEPGNYTFETLATTIKKHANGYKVTGTKIYAPENNNSDVYLIAGKLIEGENTKLALVAVGADSVNIESKSFESSNNQINIVCLSVDTEVAEDKIMFAANELRDELSVYRNMIAASAMGIAHNNLTGALCVTRNIKDSKKQAISATQSVQFTLADMYGEIEGARMLTYYSAALMDAGKPSVRFSSLAKVQATEAAVMSSSNAFELFGNAGNVYDQNYLEMLQLSYNRQIKDGTTRNNYNVIYQEALAKR